MKYPFLLISLIFFACGKQDSETITCLNENCKFLCDYGLNVNRENNAVNFEIGKGKIIDAIGKICDPDALDFYISEDNIAFTKAGRISSTQPDFRIGGLDNDKSYYFKMVNLHCSLDSITSSTLVISPGESDLPTISNNPLSVSIDEFQISTDKQQLLYRTVSDSWNLTSFNNPGVGTTLFGKSFDAIWLNEDSKIAYVSLLKDGNFLRSHKLIILDPVSNEEEILHTIDNTEEYWIHSIVASLDGSSIYFKSNKDNGASTSQEKAVYDNIWKINLETKELEQLSNFLPLDFDLNDFQEDPLRPNNFYVLGGVYSDISSERNFDLYYWNSNDKTLNPLLEDEFREYSININPDGTKLLLTSGRTGTSELWVYDVNTTALSQISDKSKYGKNAKWKNVIWKDNNTLLTYLYFEEIWQFVEFEVE